ncbi:MAG: NifB/NifX family molybdenum-iron cluster-binding protein [Candidatus Eremiobacteraeota bacterium]|nr:NifB/NifX family molybdenum-iron cluster-binding protein [Candidatus Eremiobacteraeota bacterium]
MKLAIPVWGKRISPVFDTAKKLMIIEIQNNRETRRHEVLIPEGSVIKRAGLLSDLGVNVLICGAITRRLAVMIESCGIKVIPLVSGTIEEIISAYLMGDFPTPTFIMPGCRGRRGRWRHGGRGRRHGPAQFPGGTRYYP